VKWRWSNWRLNIKRVKTMRKEMIAEEVLIAE
jgi:hypothetical protein